MRRSLVILALPLALLAGCNPTPPAPVPSSPVADDPTPAATEPGEAPASIHPDALLVVSATATASNGAVLDLRMEVLAATAWSDPAAADRPALMTARCEGYLEASVYEDGLWSFVPVEVTATADPSTPAWPADKRIRLWPGFSDVVALASSGFLVEDPDVSDDTPPCQRYRYLYGAGEGVLLEGIQGDTDEVAAAGQFTRWANGRYGFVAREVQGQSAASAGMVLTDCQFVVTEKGAELNGGASWWGSHVDESDCYTGSNES